MSIMDQWLADMYAREVKPAPSKLIVTPRPSSIPPIMYMDIDATIRCAECKSKAPRISGLTGRRHTPWEVKWGKRSQCDDCGMVYDHTGARGVQPLT